MCAYACHCACAFVCVCMSKYYLVGQHTVLLQVQQIMHAWENFHLLSSDDTKETENVGYFLDIFISPMYISMEKNTAVPT